MTRTAFLATWLAALVALPSLTTPMFAGLQESAAGPELLFKLEADFARDAEQRGHEAFVEWFADDGVELDDGGGISSKDDMRKQPAWADGTMLTWTPVHAEMAASKDLGYTYGNYVFRHKDEAGKLITDYGKYTSIWKKQKDGSWKVVVDMGNSSPAPKQQ